MSYTVLLTKSARRELERLLPRQHDYVVKHLQAMADNPRPFGSEKLHGRDEYKLRVGDYRIVYGIDDAAEEVLVYMIDDRKQVDRRLKRR